VEHRHGSFDSDVEGISSPGVINVVPDGRGKQRETIEGLEALADLCVLYEPVASPRSIGDESEVVIRVLPASGKEGV
jgi:hypothetical protein